MRATLSIILAVSPCLLPSPPLFFCCASLSCAHTADHSSIYCSVHSFSLSIYFLLSIFAYYFPFCSRIRIFRIAFYPIQFEDRTKASGRRKQLSTHLCNLQDNFFLCNGSKQTNGILRKKRQKKRHKNRKEVNLFILDTNKRTHKYLLQYSIESGRMNISKK